jgi:uncharacterized SAM-binding protein YcdF (DUF218 family)
LALLRKKSLRWAIPVLALVFVLLTHGMWLRLLGDFLVRGQEPFKADIIVVLGGDDRGNRILKAAELMRQGYAPKILVSAPYCCYGHIESDVAIPFAIRHGYPPDWFVSLSIKGTSTVEEAKEIVRELDRQGIGRFVIVTSNYHTRRAAAIYRGLVSGDRFRVVAAPDWAFRPEDWWQNREGQKQAFFEWAKTMANWAGL